MNSEKADCNFLSRLEFLLNGRKAYSWGRSLGLGDSPIDAMFKQGILPKGQTLIAIQRRENANISWLLAGTGSPYLVEHCRDDDACRAQVRLILEEPGWSVVIADDGTRQALILTLPCSYQHATQKRPLPYVDLHILTNAGPKAIDDAVAIAADVRSLRLKPKPFDDLISGQVGSYRLLGDDKTPGALARATPIDRDGVMQVAEAIAAYGQDGAPSDLRPDEIALLKKYRVLSLADRSRLQTITDALAAAVNDRGDGPERTQT